jgi:ABC-type amino acid transport substrate-binding protein
MKRMYLAAIAVLCASIVAPALAADDAVAKIRDAGVIKICHAEALPWAVKDAATGEWKGTDIYAAQDLAEALGVKVEHVDSTWQTLIPNLEGGKCDIAMAPMFRTTERVLRILFSEPSGFETQSIGIKADSGIKTYADLDQEGRSVVVISGTADETFALRHFKKAKVTPVVTDKVSQLMVEVASGRADGFLTDSSTAKRGVKENTSMGLAVLEPENPINPQGYSYGIRKGEYDLLNVINVWQETTVQSGKKEKWYSEFAN